MEDARGEFVGQMPDCQVSPWIVMSSYKSGMQHNGRMRHVVPFLPEDAAQ
jgi:hypothetical protein